MRIRPKHLHSESDTPRRSQHRGQLFYRLLEQATQTPHAGYRDLVLIGGAKSVTPTHRRGHAAWLRPWPSQTPGAPGAGSERALSGARLQRWQSHHGGA